MNYKMRKEKRREEICPGKTVLEFFDHRTRPRILAIFASLLSLSNLISTNL